MPSIWKRRAKPQAELYQFLDAEELLPEEPIPEPEEEEPEAPEEVFLEEELPEEEEPEEAPPPPKEEKPDPVSYAQIQANSILQDARRRADALLAEARQEAQRDAEKIRERARQDGMEAGRAEGLEAGFAQAMEESRKAREAEAAAMAEEIRRFLDGAGDALDRQLDENVGQLRDLAIAVAEKVICVSLKSSGDVIGRMIQTAVDKRRRREWVHIYIAECDAKYLAEIPPSLMAALSALSDRVRIVPLADDEAGTCIIEMPDEIIDASATTQMNNIRAMLADTPVGGRDAIFQRRRSVDRVPTNGSPGL